MLNKQNRLTKRKEFGYIYKKGKHATTNCLTLMYVSTKLKEPRFGFSVSKKIGKAWQRNKTKRQLREIVRAMLPNINQSFNYVFVVKPQIVNLSFEQLQKEVKSILTKANLLV